MRPFLAFVLSLSAARIVSGADDAVTVDVVGTLHTGVVAVGGETTGRTITSDGITWELDFADADAPKRAEALNGKKVRVEGTLTRKAGVEQKERWIVRVRKLSPVAREPNEAPLPRFEATARRDDTRITLLTSGSTTVVDVACPSGIDTATIQRGGEDWPETLVVRLHLRGLESFKATQGDIAVEWSVSSTEPNKSRQTLHSGKQESRVAEDSPYRAPLRMFASERGIPLKNGYFEVAIPPKLLEGNPRELKLSWIDFYRN